MNSYIFKAKDGYIGFVYSRKGLKKVYFDVSSNTNIHGKIRRNYPQAQNDPVGWLQLRENFEKYFQGMRVDFSLVKLDLTDQTDFKYKVYTAAQKIKYGETVSYEGLAHKVNLPGAARAVGQAMANNPCLIVIPCHRVINKDGRPGGWSGPKGLKSKLLELEGIYLK